MNVLLGATMLLPALMALAELWPAARRHVSSLLWLAPLPGLAAALLLPDGASLLLDARLQLGFMLDRPGAVLLGVAALLWSAAGVYAHAYLGAKPHAERFATLWLLTLSGSLGCFIAADLVSFYTAFALASLPPFGLVVHDGSARALRAGRIYLGLSLGGEVVLLLAFVMLALAAPGESLAITHVVAALPAYPAYAAVVVLLLVGFGLKAGLVPLHVWLPLAHPAAPMPASAVLSGAIIKAGIIGMLRFLPAQVALPDWGLPLAGLGMATALYAVLVGITQANPKTVLAYSSVSQMGVAAAALGLGHAGAMPATAIAVAFYAAHHVLAKGALFLSVGVAQSGRRNLWPLVLAPALVLSLGFGGMPLTGGYLAKLATKPQFADGLPELFSAVSAAGSTLLMLHFTRRLAASAAGEGSAPAGLMAPWLLLAAAAILVPWVLMPALDLGSVAYALAPASLAKALWPVAAGALLALLLARFGTHLPSVPEGDLVVFGERLADGVSKMTGPIARAEQRLASWPAAGTLLVALILLLTFALTVDMR